MTAPNTAGDGIALYSDRVVFPDSGAPAWITIADGKIVSVGKKPENAKNCYDFSGKYLSPGFIDLHTHGAAGYDFLNENAEGILAGCRFQLSHGATAVCPTLSAAPFPKMRGAVRETSRAMRVAAEEEPLSPHILGAHLEGPYLSPAQSGAQCADFLTSPRPEEYEPLIEEYAPAIARWSFAPELDSGGRFCRFLSDHAILAAIAHSDATYPDVLRAVENGCRLVTHLYSCTSTVTRDHGFRSLGVIESAFLLDELSVEVIADGRHLPPELIRMIVKIKGKERVAAVTDSLHIAGTSVREGVMSGTPFLVEDGVCKLRDRSAFAGSIATADRLVRTLVFDCGFPIPDAVAMCSRTPAAIMGLAAGEIREGCAADLVVFDEKIRVHGAFVAGKYTAFASSEKGEI